MARSFSCNTSSPVGNIILGVLFLLLGVFLLLMPCVAILGPVTGSMTPPKDGHEFLGTLVGLGVLLVLAAVLIPVGILCMHTLILPRTLEVTGKGIELRWFSKRLGSIPFANVKGVQIKTRGMAGQTANGAFFQGFASGGLLGGFIAQSRFDPNEAIGFIIKLHDADDPDTTWPKGFFQKEPKKRLDVDYCWRMSHRKLVEQIENAMSRHDKDQIRGT